MFVQGPPLLLAVGATDILVIALFVLAPSLAAYGVFQLVSDLRGASKKKIASRLRGQSTKRDGKNANAVKDVRRQVAEASGVLGQAFANFSFTARLQTILEQANLSWSASRLLTNLSAVAAITVAAFVVVGLPILAGLGAGLAVFVLPILYLMWRRKARMKKFVLQLPDVFELLSQALRAGHSLASGMQLIATEVPEPAGTEFSRVFQEQNLGLKIEDALVNLAKRMDMLDVRFFVTAVLIQRQTGGDLAEVLDKIGGVIRDRIKLQGTVTALTAEGRLSGYVLLALPVIVYIAMLKINPDYAMVLLEDPTGQMLLTGAAVMMVMGYFMIQKIVNIKV